MSDSLLPKDREKDLRLGIIGCGSIARFHADVLKHLGYTIVAASDIVYTDKIKEFCKTYSIKEFAGHWDQLTKMKLDALWVTASWNSIDEMLLPLLATGIPIFFEKPVALSSKKIISAIEAYPDSLANTQIGYNRRFYDFIPEIKALISTLDISAIELQIPESVSGLNNDNLKKVLFLQNSSHVIDLLFYLLGEKDLTVENIKRFQDHNGLPLGYSGLLLSESGIPIHLVAPWNSPCNFGIRFHSPGQLVELLPIETARIYEGFEIIEPTQQNPIRRYKPKILKEFFINKNSAQFKPGFLNQAINFIDTCILKNKTNSIASTLRSALSVTGLCEKIMYGKE
jgi:hypothetical protein